MFPVTLVTVVEASVEDPVLTKLVEVRFPEKVPEAEFSEVTFVFPAITFPSVVLANVEDPETARFTEFVVVEFVVDE